MLPPVPGAGLAVRVGVVLACRGVSGVSRRGRVRGMAWDDRLERWLDEERYPTGAHLVGLALMVVFVVVLIGAFWLVKQFTGWQLVDF